MSIRLDQLLSEADEILEKKASPKIDIAEDDDIFKLAERLSNDVPEETLVETPIEKIARAIAIVETVQTINALEKLDKFEKNAKDNGYTDEEISTFVSENNITPLHKVLTIPDSYLI